MDVLNRETITGRSVNCDQGVFTSIPSPMGSGYRLVSASRGIDPKEKQHIITRCPSHGSLCSEEIGAEGVSFYGLPSGRFCIAHSCNAGKEHTGRGGQRIYTRIVVLDADALWAFNCNPFEVVRSLLKIQDAEPNLKPPANPPPLELPVCSSHESTRLEQCVRSLGAGWLAAVVDRVIGESSIIMTTELDAIALAEAVVLSLPKPGRRTASLSAGLKFSMGRGFTLSVLDEPNPQRLRATLQGHKMTLVVPKDNPPAALSNGGYAGLVERRWQENRTVELFDFTNGDFASWTADSLGRYASLVNRRDRVAEMSPDELLQLLDQQIHDAPIDDVASRLAIETTAAALAGLRDSIWTLHADQLVNLCDGLMAIWRDSESSADLFSQVLQDGLKRLTRQHPANAARLALRFAQAVRDGAELASVQESLHDLIDHLGEWILDQPSESLTELAHVLDSWSNLGVLADRIGTLREQLSQRGRNEAVA